MPSKRLLKDQLVNREKVAQLAKGLRQAYPPFQTDAFVRSASRRLPELELKARISWVTQCLRRYLPNGYRDAVRVLLASLPHPNDPHLVDGDFGDFIYASYSEFVATYGCTRKELTFSLETLRAMTTRFSAEVAIRFFINAYPDETLKALKRWSLDPHYHVRRLASEGTRPKLPWAQKIALPVTAPLPILNNLFADTTRFVTRSVANHINDISKIDPSLAIATLARWRAAGKQTPGEMDYMTRHALRTLVKRGNTDALRLLGYSDPLALTIESFVVSDTVAMDTALEFSFVLRASSAADVVVDYAISFPGKAGRHRRKVFKLRTVSLVKNKPAVMFKRHMFRSGMTTRALYPGPHLIELQINGIPYGEKAFNLV